MSKRRFLNTVSEYLSKSNSIYKLSRMIVKAQDNDGNANMLTNGELTVLRYLAENGLLNLVFDVGANVGDYSRKITEQPGSIAVHAFEPGPGNLISLRQSFGYNDAVQIVPFALSDSPGSIPYYETCDPHESGHNSVHDMDRIGYDYPTQRTTVEATTLDIYCRENGIGKIDFMKLDVEGHEMSVLMGGTHMLESRSVDYIQFEFGHAAAAARVFLHDLTGFLEGYGYRLFVVKPRGLEEFTYSPFAANRWSMVNFFAASDVASESLVDLVL
jgi:FkbM family methyltransferase